jgi:hypothetical protein
MSDQGFASHLFEGVCVGTVSATIAQLLVHPLTAFTDKARQSSANVVRMARDTTFTSLMTGASKETLRSAPAVGLALGLHEVGLQRTLGRDSNDLGRTRFWKSFAVGSAAGAVEGLVAHALARPLPSGAPTTAAAVQAPFRGLFFGLDAAVRPTFGPGSQPYLTWVPQFVCGWYTTLIALMLTHPLRTVADRASAAGISWQEAANHIREAAGASGFFRGAGANVFLAMRGSTALLVFYALRDASPTL